MLDKLEKRFGKYAVPNLMNYLIGGYIIGYIFTLLIPDILGLMTLEPHLIITKLQLWRIVTWVLIPPSSIGFFTLIMLFFYWQLGRSLEYMWGTFRFNVYIFGGIIITVLGAFALYLITALNPNLFLYQTGSGAILRVSESMGMYFSTYYINMSIFLAYAMSMPEARVYLYFFIPIKMKWLAVLYALLVGTSFINARIITERVSIACSLFNFVLFFLSTRKLKFVSGRNKGNNSWFGKRQQGQQNNRGWNPYQGANSRTTQNTSGQNTYNNNKQSFAISRHKCAICGRTEITNPGMEFRFCSKCNGNYEYCSDHLFSHEHVK